MEKSMKLDQKHEFLASIFVMHGARLLRWDRMIGHFLSGIKNQSSLWALNVFGNLVVAFTMEIDYY